jgi:hypothetical protein
MEARFAEVSNDQFSTTHFQSWELIRSRQEITFTNMTPVFWRLARRDEEEYPSWIFD